MDTVLQWEDTRGCRYVLILAVRVKDIVLRWEDTRGMQVCISIGC